MTKEIAKTTRNSHFSPDEPNSKLNLFPSTGLFQHILHSDNQKSETRSTGNRGVSSCVRINGHRCHCCKNKAHGQVSLFFHESGSLCGNLINARFLGTWDTIPRATGSNRSLEGWVSSPLMPTLAPRLRSPGWLVSWCSTWPLHRGSKPATRTSGREKNTWFLFALLVTDFG